MKGTSMNNLKQKIRDLLYRSFESREKDIALQLQRKALERTAEYVEAHMSRARVFDKYGLLAHALECSKREGLVCEFGVFKGDTINFIARKTPRVVHGFDSFEGLPEDWRTGYGASAFDLGGCLPRVEPNVKLHAGLFDKTLPPFLEEFKESISFLHVDCDLYTSTKTVFQFLGKWIQAGTIIVFDEYFNYPSWEEHEFRAFQEFVAQDGIEYEYLGYSCRDEQAAVRILKA